MYIMSPIYNFSEVTAGGEVVAEVDRTTLSGNSLLHASIQVDKTPIVT
jgi:hypothetical protein